MTSFGQHQLRSLPASVKDRMCFVMIAECRCARLRVGLLPVRWLVELIAYSVEHGHRLRPHDEATTLAGVPLLGRNTSVKGYTRALLVSLGVSSEKGNASLDRRIFSSP